MKLPWDLSGREVVDALVRKLNYRVVHERDSHVVLETDSPQAPENRGSRPPEPPVGHTQRHSTGRRRP